MKYTYMEISGRRSRLRGMTDKLHNALQDILYAYPRYWNSCHWNRNRADICYTDNLDTCPIGAQGKMDEGRSKQERVQNARYS